MITNQNLSLFSDLHKDAYGYRPSQGQFERVREMNDAQLHELFDSMQRDLAGETDREQRGAALRRLQVERQ